MRGKKKSNFRCRWGMLRRKRRDREVCCRRHRVFHRRRGRHETLLERWLGVDNVVIEPLWENYSMRGC